MTRAIFIGRFQPFHNAHLVDVRNILKKADEIIIAIGSSQEKNTKENPFSYNERKGMITKTLKNNKVKNFKIYPVPDLYDDYKWTSYILENLPKFEDAYSGNEWTIRCFRKHKINAHKIKLIKGISSTIIRKMVVNNKNWEKLVPEEIYTCIKKIKGETRINNLSKNSIKANQMHS
ncbi:MAG: nicotinamide-nucleotide adenylyltransferase [Nanoarchaeota archaeon]